MRKICILVCLVALLAGSWTMATAGEADKVRKEAIESLNQGVSALRKGESARAVEALSKSASMALNNFRAHFFLGQAYIQNREYQKAIEPLKIALDLDPSHLLAHIALGDAYLNIGDTQEANAQYFLALKLKPDFAAAVDGIARSYVAKQQSETAITKFKEAIDFDAGFAPAYTHLGQLYFELGNIDLAIDSLTQAISIRPDYAEGLNKLAEAYGKLGLYQEAVASIQSAVALEPNSADHLAKLGEFLLGLESTKAAEEALLKAIELDSTWPTAHLGLAEIKRRAGEYGQALSQLQIPLADPRTTPQEQRTILAKQARIEEERKRLQLLETRVAAGNLSSQDRIALAAIYAGRQAYARALEVTIPGEFETVDDRAFIAWLELKNGQYRAAARDFRALATETNQADYWSNAGVALARLGQNEQAVEAYREALKINPNLREVRFYLASALYRMGNQEAAQQSWQALTEIEKKDAWAERAQQVLDRLTTTAKVTDT